MIKAVLFDLDGTLLDTALDIILALTRLCEENHFPKPDAAKIRPLIGLGAKNLVQQCVSLDINSEEFALLVKRLLEIYSDCLAETTEFFPGIEAVLDYLKQQGIRWGVVTNKVQRFTLPICEAFEPLAQASCIISGDTLALQKPDPAPLLHASELLNIPPEKCIFIGDSIVDMQAGQAAKMKAYVASYGYIPLDEDISRWPSQGIIRHPLEIIDLLKGTHAGAIDY